MSKPEDRYIKLDTKTLADGRMVYKSAIPKTVETSIGDTTVIASDTDRLDIIANNVYGTPSDWWKLAAANRHVNGSVHVKPGSTIVIPKV